MKKLQNSLIIFIICVLAKAGAGQTMPLIPWLSGDQYGIANEAGDILVQPQYEDVAVFPDCPLALVKKGGWWGVVDGKGNMLIPPVIQGEITSQHTSFAGVKIMPAFKRNSILESATFEKSNIFPFPVFNYSTTQVAPPLPL